MDAKGKNLQVIVKNVSRFKAIWQKDLEIVLRNAPDVFRSFRYGRVKPLHVRFSNLEQIPEDHSVPESSESERSRNVNRYRNPKSSIPRIEGITLIDDKQNAYFSKSEFESSHQENGKVDPILNHNKSNKSVKFADLLEPASCPVNDTSSSRNEGHMESLNKCQDEAGSTSDIKQATAQNHEPNHLGIPHGEIQSNPEPVMKHQKGVHFTDLDKLSSSSKDDFTSSRRDPNIRSVEIVKSSHDENEEIPACGKVANLTTSIDDKQDRGTSQKSQSDTSLLKHTYHGNHSNYPKEKRKEEKMELLKSSLNHEAQKSSDDKTVLPQLSKSDISLSSHGLSRQFQERSKVEKKTVTFADSVKSSKYDISSFRNKGSERSQLSVKRSYEETEKDSIFGGSQSLTDLSSKKRRTRPDTVGKFHGRTLLFGKEVPPRHIPLDPLYIKYPVRRSGAMETVPKDPRPEGYSKRKKYRLKDKTNAKKHEEQDDKLLKLIPITEVQPLHHYFNTKTESSTSGVATTGTRHSVSADNIFDRLNVLNDHAPAGSVSNDDFIDIEMNYNRTAEKSHRGKSVVAQSSDTKAKPSNSETGEDNEDRSQRHLWKLLEEMCG